MADSFEKKAQNKELENPLSSSRYNISVLKYFWQRSPLSGHRKEVIPNFLRSLRILKNFTDNELRTFSQYLHVRNFTPSEVVFKQDDVGFGFYFILSGRVLVFGKEVEDIKRSEKVIDVDEEGGKIGGDEKLVLVASLEKFDYFGEIALVQERSLRTATAISKGESVLLGIFKPDVEELIDAHPVIGAKLLQSLSLIVANRFTTVAEEVRMLRLKLYQLEKNAKDY